VWNILPPPTGNFFPSNRQLFPLQPATFSPPTGNSYRPAICADRIRLSNPLQTGNIYRPARLAAQLRIRTASDRQNLPLMPLASLISTGIRRACWGGRSFLKPPTVFPEAPAHPPGISALYLYFRRISFMYISSRMPMTITKMPIAPSKMIRQMSNLRSSIGSIS